MLVELKKGLSTDLSKINKNQKKMGNINGVNCAYCNGRFTCGCQKTKDEDGRTVHKNCVNKANTIIRDRKEKEATQ